MLTLPNLIVGIVVAAALHLPQSATTEKQKIEALIAHVAALDNATFIRNGDEYPPADAADHMRTKWEYAGSRVKTALQFIEHIASKSSMSGDPYLIRFDDGSETESGPYLSDVLREIETAANNPAEVVEQSHDDHHAAAEKAMQNLEPLMGDWEGTITGEGPDGSPSSIAINWTTTKVFDGRWIRFEFTSKDQVAPGRFVEWEGLFTANPETGEIETVWMTPHLRVTADATRFLDGRRIFFEKGRWDEAGRVLTLIAHKQNAPEEPIIEVKSTFTIAEDGGSFTVVDEEEQPDGSWKTSGTFNLQRRHRPS